MSAKSQKEEAADESPEAQEAEVLVENGEPVSADAQASEDSALASAQEENQKLLDQLIRMKAEFENFRKRADRDKPALIRHGRDEILEKLLPLYDALLTAHDQVLRVKSSGEADSGEIVRGLELTFQEFSKFFAAEGVTVMNAVGDPYDVNKHEVLGQVATDEHEEGTVMEVLQRGYLQGDRTLRTAKVRIAKKA